MTHFADEEIDGLLRSHEAQMEAERKNDARTAMHPPEQRADALLRSGVKSEIPIKQSPIKRIALDPEAGAECLTVRPVARGHELLQPVAGNEFVEDRGAREVRVVAAHAHHALVIGHGVGWITHD